MERWFVVAALIIRAPWSGIVPNLGIWIWSSQEWSLFVQESRKQFVERWQNTNRATVSDIFFVPFSDGLLLSVFCAMFLQYIFLALTLRWRSESIVSFVAMSQFLMSSARIPLLSMALPFLSLMIAACISSPVIESVSSLLPSSLKLFRQFHRFHLICCRFRRRHVRSLSSMWFVSPSSSSTLGISTLFLAALMQDMFLVPLHSSKDLWNLFLSFWSFLVSDTHSDLFTHFFWGVSAFWHNPVVTAPCGTSSFETSSSLS